MRVAGMIKRIGGALPYVHQSKYRALEQFVRAVLIPFLFPDPKFELKTFDAYIEGRDFTVHKKQQWKEYHDTTMSKLGRYDKRDTYVATHTKLEFYTEPKFYRGIYARSDRFKASYGPLISSIEDVVYKLQYFIKSVPVTQRPKYIHEFFGEDDVYSNDHSAYESSNNPYMMNSVLRPIYEHIASSHLDLVNDYMNALTSEQYIKATEYTAKTFGRRMSGEMDTSLGNGLVNLATIMYVLWSHGAKLDDIKVIVEGDDSLFKVVPGVCEMDFKDLGFSPKLECVGKCYQASFCGMIFTPKDYVNISDPIKALLKLGWCDAKYIDASQRVLDELYRSKLMCAMVQYYQCPVIYPYLYKEFMRIGPGKTRTLGFWYDEIIKQFTTIDVSKPPKILSTTRIHMEEQFGITVASQLAFEQSKTLDLCSFFNVNPKYIDAAQKHKLNIFSTTTMSYSQCARLFYPLPVAKSWLWDPLNP